MSTQRPPTLALRVFALSLACLPLALREASAACDGTNLTPGAVDLCDLAVPGERLYDWEAGWETRACFASLGGGPNDPACHIEAPNTADRTQWPIHATIDPSTGSCASLQAAIDSASAAPLATGQEGWIVKIGPGTISCGAALILKSNVIVQGSGRGQTRLAIAAGAHRNCSKGSSGGTCSTTNPTPEGNSYLARTYVSDASALSKNGRSWPVASTSDLSVGDFVVITADCGGLYPKYDASRVSDCDSSGLGGRGVTTEGVITAINGNSIVLDRKRSFDWTHPNPGTGITVYEFVGTRRVGLENMEITDDRRDSAAVMFALTRGYLLRDVLVHKPNVTDTSDIGCKATSLLRVQHAYRGLVVANTFGRLPWVAANQVSCRYQISFNYVFDTLITDNEFRWSNIGVRLFHWDSGNVISHNYVHDSGCIQGLESCDPDVHKRGRWAWGFEHGHYHNGNLWEANDVSDHDVSLADQWHGLGGPSVWYRNRVVCRDPGRTGGQMCGTIGKLIAGQGGKTGEGFTLIGNFFYDAGTLGRSPGAPTACMNAGFFDANDGATGCGDGGSSPNDMRDTYWERNIAYGQAGGDGLDWHAIHNTTLCDNKPCPPPPFGTGPDGDHKVFGTNIEAQCAPNLGDNCSAAPNHGSGDWASMDAPVSLYFASQADWEARTGQTWCQEACAFDTVQGSIGAWGDRGPGASGGQYYCKLPAEIVASGGTCTPSGAPPPPPPAGTRPSTPIWQESRRRPGRPASATRSRSRWRRAPRPCSRRAPRAARA
jgi:hypothetical protein